MALCLGRRDAMRGLTDDATLYEDGPCGVEQGAGQGKNDARNKLTLGTARSLGWCESRFVWSGDLCTALFANTRVVDTFPIGQTCTILMERERKDLEQQLDAKWTEMRHRLNRDVLLYSLLWNGDYHDAFWALVEKELVDCRK